MNKMNTKKEVRLENNLQKFEIAKKEALSIEGGPKLSRGTVTMPASDDE